MTIKREKKESVTYSVILTFKDGSTESCTVTAANGLVVRKVARGWMSASALSVSVRFFRVDEEGRRMWLGGEYSR